MKKIFIPGIIISMGLLISAFSFGPPAGPQDPQGPHAKITTAHIPFFAVFDQDSFKCDPAEAKHQGRVNHRYNTLHMKEKGEDNIIVHFKSSKYTAANGKPDNDYVHFDVLYDSSKPGRRQDTHLSLTWKGKKYHVKGNMCAFSITNVTWKPDSLHFTFSADFNARVETGGSDTTSHIFRGRIVDELVKAKTQAARHPR